MNWLKRNWASIVGVTVVISLLYVWLFSPLGTSDRVGITTGIGTVALVIATSVYASHTRKMAEEMREQRYSALLPIVDIQLSGDNTRHMQMQLSSKERLFSEGVPCVLRNIGLGPAIDVYTFVQHPSLHECQRHDLGTVPIECQNNVYGELGLTIDRAEQIDHLSLDQQDEAVVVAAYFTDVYGRHFKSKRELQGEMENWRLGPLHVEEVNQND